MVANHETLTVSRRGNTRLWIVLIGVSLVLGAFLAPWWTRGFGVDKEKLDDAAGDDFGDEFITFPGLQAGSQGTFLHYGPFYTPSGGGHSSTDASRETITSVLGVAMVLSTLFMATSLTVRYLAARGKIEISPNAAVNLAIGGFLAGLIAVLIGALFVPLMGSNPGLAYGDEFPSQLEENSDGIFYTSRYLNAGFFLGVLSFIGFSAYVWADATRARSDAQATVDADVNASAKRRQVYS